MRNPSDDVECDCLNWCGDDPWLAKGLAQPCERLVLQRRKAAIAAAQTEARVLLHKRHGTTTIEDLVEAQANHIAQLEAKRVRKAKP